MQPIAWPVNVVVLIDGVPYPFTDEKAAQVATALQMVTPAFKWTAAAQQVRSGCLQCQPRIAADHSSLQVTCAACYYAWIRVESGSPHARHCSQPVPGLRTHLL